MKSPFLQTVKIKIVSSLVATSGDIDFDFTEKSQYFIGKHIRKPFYCMLKTDKLLASHDKAFIIKQISNVQNPKVLRQGLPISLGKISPVVLKSEGKRCIKFISWT